MSKTEEYCPLGYYCPAGSEMPTPCPDGHYCPVVNDTGVLRGKLLKLFLTRTIMAESWCIRIESLRCSVRLHQEAGYVACGLYTYY